MKNCLVFVTLVIAAFVFSGNALPARKRMIYYQQPAAAQWYGAPQRSMMYVQYVQPSSARSAQASSALVAGETVAAGTYLEDCNHAESDVAAEGSTVQHGEDVLSAAGAHSAHSVAEAYPDDSGVEAPAPPSLSSTVEDEAETTGTIVADVPSVAVSTDEQQPEQTPTDSDNASKTPRDYNFEANVSDEPAPPAPPAVPEVPEPAPIVPVSTAAVVPPARRYLPSKKVYVELDQSVETTDDEQTDAENAIAVADDEEVQEEEEETDVAAVVPVAPKKPVQKPIARRPVVKNPVKPVKSAADCAGCAKAGSSGSQKPQIPAGTFFPIDFGGTTGGAIAIANSFSTGEGGSATSHAIAYGSPDAVRARVRPSKLH